MLFNSFIFLFLFLPAAVISFYALKKFSFRLALTSLVVFSLTYYAYWKPEYIFLILGSVAVNFILAQGISKRSENLLRDRAKLFFAIFLNLSLLGYFKYAGFFIQSLNDLTPADMAAPEIILPLGISFFTFQQIAYQVDVFQQKIKPDKFLDYILFVSFFPQLIAGPIVHHSEMMPQFKNGANKKFYWGNIAVGLTIFVIGLFKKTVLADSLAGHVSPIYSDAADGHMIDFYTAWIAALGYTFQLYFDFSGYSDMAIGCARMFGIRLPCNFFSPYKATNVIEFWRRWHMTLSRFLRDYVYIPLGGNRHGTFVKTKSLFLTMFLGGIWHGAGWTFILWGTLHGIFLIANNFWRNLSPQNGTSSRIYRFSAWLLTFLTLCVTWVIFRAESMDSAFIILGAMFDFGALTVPVKILNYGLIPAALSEALGVSASSSGTRPLLDIAVAMLIALSMPNTHQIMQRFRPSILPRYLSGKNLKSFLVWRPNAAWAVFATILLIAALVKTFTGTSEFLYYDF